MVDRALASSYIAHKLRSREIGVMSGCKILRTSETAKQLCEILKAPGCARLAVAFWGDGAVKRLGLDTRQGETRVVCDLYSGGCNPEEIAKLLIHRIEVRYLDKLHAKFYSTPGAVVLGSSNASPSGLARKGEKPSGNIELIFSLTTGRSVRKWKNGSTSCGVNPKIMSSTRTC
jgi:hypothetical protein